MPERHLSSNILLCLDDQLAVPPERLPLILPVQLLQGWHGEEVPDGDKEALAAEVFRALAPVTYDPDDVGCRGIRIRAIPPGRFLQPVVDAEGQGQGGRAGSGPDENTDAAQHMPEYHGGLALGLGLLREPFHTRHMPSFLGLLHAVPKENRASIKPEDGGGAQHRPAPGVPDLPNVPRSRAQELHERVIMRGRKGQAAYGGCDAQLVLAGHNPKDERAEPEVGISPWKTVAKKRQGFS